MPPNGHRQLSGCSSRKGSPSGANPGSQGDETGRDGSTGNFHLGSDARVFDSFGVSILLPLTVTGLRLLCFRAAWPLSWPRSGKPIRTRRPMTALRERMCSRAAISDAESPSFQPLARIASSSFVHGISAITVLKSWRFGRFDGSCLLALFGLPQPIRTDLCSRRHKDSLLRSYCTTSPALPFGEMAATGSTQLKYWGLELCYSAAWICTPRWASTSSSLDMPIPINFGQ